MLQTLLQLQLGRDSRESGIMSGLSREQNSELSASVQASVADVIQDITGETNSSTKSKIWSSSATDTLVETSDWPMCIHQQISVPLASRVLDKIQSKIWANEYLGLSTLLNTTCPSDSRYNFVIQSMPSTSWRVISLKKTSENSLVTAFQTFVTIHTVWFSTVAPVLMKYSKTVRELATKKDIGAIMMQVFVFWGRTHFSLGSCGCRHTKCKKCTIYHFSHSLQGCQGTLSNQLLLEISRRGNVLAATLNMTVSNKVPCLTALHC